MATLRVRKPRDLGTAIRAAREDVGYTQSELADRLAFSRQYMVELESGDPNLYAKRLFRTLHELGMTLTVTYGGNRGDA